MKKNKDNKKINILLITDDVLQLSTAPSSRLFRLGQIFSEQGFGVSLMPLHNKLPLGLRSFSRKSSYLRRIYLTIKMFFDIKSSKFNAVLVRGVYIGVAALFISKFFRKSLYYDFHGLCWKEEEHKGNTLKSILFRVLEYILLSYSTIILAQTKSNKFVAHSYNNNSLFLGNGINVKDFIDEKDSNILEKYKIPSNLNLIGFIGNWENWMNVEDLLKSSEYISDSKVIIVGEGKGIEDYRKHYSEVIFTGRIPHRDAIQILHHLDVCISPHSDDIIMKYKSAVKTLEYMAAGKPMIISDVVGKEDFLEEFKNCLFYEPNNPKDLASKVMCIIKDKNLLTSMSKVNKVLSQDFSWENVVKNSGIINELNKFDNQT